jgi:mRNA-degrading endonuclease RelE of RelBE toxin-antitoxin system
MLLVPRDAKALQKLDEVNKGRVKKALGELASDPYKVGEQLIPSHYWKIKAGDYRAIYEIEKDKKELVIIFLGHRKNVYDDFSRLLF